MVRKRHVVLLLALTAFVWAAWMSFAVDEPTITTTTVTRPLYPKLTRAPVDTTKALPPGASWSAEEARDVAYQASPLKRNARLENTDEVLFRDRCKAGGYPRGVDTQKMPPEIAEVPVHSELFLSDCDFADEKFRPSAAHCEAVAAVRKEVDLLDQAIMYDPVVRKKHKTHRPKPGQGLAARGWGIAGPFTNKWIFYERHLRAAQASPLRPTPATHGLHLCEVGFLAGHSTAIFSALLGHKAFASVHVFDLPQPGTGYSAVGMHTIRGRFRAESPHTKFHFYATLSREGIHAAIATGRMSQCDFISLDGSKLRGDVIQDFRLMSHVAHAGSIVICDDMWTSKMLKASAARQPLDVEEHNALMGGMVAHGLIEIVDVWHSDVKGWPAYGNVAVRFKKFGRDFDDAVEAFMRKIHSTAAVSSALPFTTFVVPEQRHSKDWLMRPTCQGEHVNALARASSIRVDVNLPVTVWDRLRGAIEACITAPTVTRLGQPGAIVVRSDVPWKTAERCGGDEAKVLNASTTPRRPILGIVNPFDLGTQVLVWAASRTRDTDHAGVCVVDPATQLDSNLVKVVATVASRRVNSDSTHVKVFSSNRDRLPQASANQHAAEDCLVSRVEGNYIDTRYPAVKSLATCGTVVLDARDSNQETVSFVLETLLDMTDRPTKAYSMFVLHNVNAAGVVGAIAEFGLDMLRWRKWPRSAGGPAAAPDAAAPEDALPRGAFKSAAPDFIVQQLRQYETAVGTLRELEVQLVSLALALEIYVAYGALPLDAMDGAKGTLIVTRKNFKLKTASANIFGWSAITDIGIGPPE